MLAKLKILRQEDKALQEIETKLRAQLNRLKQEERVLRRQMRKNERSLSEDDPEIAKEMEAEPHVDDEVINQEPLKDLNDAATSILQMCQAQYIEERMGTEEEEEEDEEEIEENEENIDDDDRGVEDEIGAEYRKLFNEMRAEVDYDDDDFEDC